MLSIRRAQPCEHLSLLIHFSHWYCILIHSKRYCFNDEYHNAHNPVLVHHWRYLPRNLLRSGDVYRKGGTLVFHNLDTLVITTSLLGKDYNTLAECLESMDGNDN